MKITAHMVMLILFTSFNSFGQAVGPTARIGSLTCGGQMSYRQMTLNNPDRFTNIKVDLNSNGGTIQFLSNFFSPSAEIQVSRDEVVFMQDPGNDNFVQRVTGSTLHDDPSIGWTMTFAGSINNTNRTNFTGGTIWIVRDRLEPGTNLGNDKTVTYRVECEGSFL
jgi:hypothetical protein